MTEKIKREECHIGIYPYCIQFENGKAIRNCYACIEKYGYARYAKGVYEENQKNKRNWEEVLNELEAKQKSIHDYALDLEDDFYLGKARGFERSIEIINQKLAEVEK